MAKRPVSFAASTRLITTSSSVQLVLKIIDDTFLESLLELDGAAGIQRDLNEDDILAVAVAWMVFSKIQVSLIVLRFGWTLARC